ncbi:SRPBCC domain-containing protein [Echinicola rosea]|uniref:ATPase n=1 Tax=Echinicola rosea TaxID=1807691 RepID=A0ABQ1VAF4_9BACT|nr:SRPBCC domain-containing protein [Echinicola rosea]GGF48887.1 ATPase [Echinicola rosea]
MALKTNVHAEDGKQEILITREFDLPLDLLFKAYMEPEIVEQWMSTKVLKLENRQHGSYRFETTDPMGNKHGFHGTIHDFVLNEKITRTFEMENADFGAQLEFLEFESLHEGTSKLSMHVIYRSVAIRDKILQLPFVQGINLAHDRLEEVQKSS